MESLDFSGEKLVTLRPCTLLCLSSMFLLRYFFVPEEKGRREFVFYWNFASCTSSSSFVLVFLITETTRVRARRGGDTMRATKHEVEGVLETIRAVLVLHFCLNLQI